MVDMTGRKAIDAPLPPPGPVKPPEANIHGQMVAAGIFFVLSATLAGLGIQLDQWWLAAGGSAALVLFGWLFVFFKEQLKRSLRVEPLVGDSR